MDKLNNGPTANQLNRRWVITLAAVCFGIIAYGYFYSKNTTNNSSVLFGANLPLGLAIWFFLHAAFGRKKDDLKAGLSFLVIFSSLIASDLIGFSQHKSAAMQVITEIQNSFNVTQSASDPQGLQQNTDVRVNTPKAKGELGEIERFMKTHTNSNATLNKNYALELEAIGFGKLLDMDRLMQDKNLVESKIIIQKAHQIVSKYRSKIFVLLDDFRMEIGNLNVSDNVKQEMANGFDKSMAISRPQLSELWDLEAKSISESENIISLLARKKGSWVAQNGQILFSSESDLNSYNSYVATLQALATKSEAIHKQRNEYVNNILNSQNN